jgi:sarcosine oxidase subunit delta|tara:strand:+ start:186 stop:470 length:285 start_codon:yes stop_codon:yes gene_type:complete
MIQIECPFCGKRDQSEFSYGREGQITFPALNADENSWYDAVFLRKNTYGRQIETWQHTHGCRSWLLVERDTVTHKIFSVNLAHSDWQKQIEKTT